MIKAHAEINYNRRGGDEGCVGAWRGLVSCMTVVSELGYVLRTCTTVVFELCCGLGTCTTVKSELVFFQVRAR